MNFVITALPAKKAHIDVVKDIRDALVLLEGSSNITTANSRYIEFKQNGITVIAKHPTFSGTCVQRFKNAQRLLDNLGYATRVFTNAETDTFVAKLGSPPAPLRLAVAQSSAPDTHGSDTALVLLQLADSNPAHAAVFAFRLSSTTGQKGVFRDAQQSLLRAFPFIQKEIDDNGMVL